MIMMITWYEYYMTLSNCITLSLINNGNNKIMGKFLTELLKKIINENL
jgi:hypothetical protein